MTGNTGGVEPDAEALAAVGLVWEGETREASVDIWPENWQALQVFCAMGTQWRVSAGMSGLIWTGLDYTALPVVEARLGVVRAERADLFSRVRIMESSARSEMNKH